MLQQQQQQQQASAGAGNCGLKAGFQEEDPNAAFYGQGFGKDGKGKAAEAKPAGAKKL